MKTWARFLLIFFAYGIALLHTAVPHQHVKDGDSNRASLHAGCLFTQQGGGLLQKVLSTDLGFGHLETFKKGSDAEIEFRAAIVSIPIPAIFTKAAAPFTALSESSLRYIENLKRQLLLFSVSHFRAPPIA